MTYDSHTFYGYVPRPDIVPGLTCRVRHTVNRGRRVAEIVFWKNESERRVQTAKWRIVPVLHEPPKAKVKCLRLRHYAHSQGEWTFATMAGAKELIAYIVGHELYERGAPEERNIDRARNRLRQLVAEENAPLPAGGERCAMCGRHADLLFWHWCDDTRIRACYRCINDEPAGEEIPGE